MPRPVLYYISDTAYSHLKTLAQQSGFVDVNAIRLHGMSSFLDALSYMKFTDTRPEEIIERHNDLISCNRAPDWTQYYPRVARPISLKNTTVTNYMEIAEQVGIIRKQPWIIGGPSRRLPNVVLGYVFEGIGLQWITPTSLPHSYLIANVNDKFNDNDIINNNQEETNDGESNTTVTASVSDTSSNS